MINQTSRYYIQLIDYIAFAPEGDNYPVVFYEFDSPGKLTWYEHSYSEGERLDQIAEKYYKRPDLWWLIPEYNPVIEDFTAIAPGTILRIPRV